MHEAERLSVGIGILHGGKIITIGGQGKLKSKTGCNKKDDAFGKLVENGHE